MPHGAVDQQRRQDIVLDVRFSHETMYFSVFVLKHKSDDEKRGKKQRPSNEYRHDIYKENAN